jgi:chemotaxis protein CheX
MRLPQILDLGAAAPLWSGLSSVRGQALQVDASEVERFGGLCLQVLVAAQAQWRADGVEFSIVNPSSAFADGVRLMAAHELAPQGGAS